MTTEVLSCKVDDEITIRRAETIAEYRACQDAQRRAWGIADDDFVIGCVARLDPMKDHPTLLAAAASFVRDHADARFVCVGGGPAAYRDRLAALAANQSHIRQAPLFLVWLADLARNESIGRAQEMTAPAWRRF